MRLGSMRFPDLVEVRVTGTRGILPRNREVRLDRYVDGKLTGSSWVRENDHVHITVTLEVDKAA